MTSPSINRIALFFGYLWILPVTISGLFWCKLNGATLIKVDGNGVFVFLAKPNGRYAKWFTANGMAATTTGTCIIFADPIVLDDDSMLIHEYTHVYQSLVLGIFWILLYVSNSAVLWLMKKDDYRGNWFEKQAYRSQDVGRSLWLWE